MVGLGTLLIAITVMSTITIPASEAATSSLKGKGIGIIIEKPLILSGKLGYKDLMSYDNSSAQYSGGFVKINNDYKRMNAKYTDNLAFYSTSKKFTIFVDPPKAVSTQMPTITIVSNLAEFHDTGQYKIVENKTGHNDIKATQSKRVYSTARFVDSGCFNGIIQYQDWKILLDDTIQFMSHNCDSKFTKIDTTIEEYHPITKHDLATSAKYKLDQFYKQVAKDCLKKRNACNMVENRATSTMGDTR